MMNANIEGTYFDQGQQATNLIAHIGHTIIWQLKHFIVKMFFEELFGENLHQYGHKFDKALTIATLFWGH